tara:strand:+ start:74 stop:538 length:465 start_codon:yes stop_codon:yes gene_type:complete
MNAKETIQKIADALNITKDDAKEVTTEVTETPTEATAIVETPEAPEAAQVVEAVEEVKVVEETPEAVVETVDEVAETPSADRVELDAMKAQIDELKNLLKAAVREDSKEEAKIEVAEAPVAPLTHSPETTSEVSHKKIGGHGGDVLSRVYKYMS